MARTRSQAVEHALATTIYPAGMCARFTRESFGIGPSGDRDGDGDVDAVDAWISTKRRHPGDRNPPAGVPVFWLGGRKGFGHAAVSLGGGRIRTTDLPTTGNVGSVLLSEVERRWGMRYLGWSEDLNGVAIPLDPAPAPKPSRPADVQAGIDAAKRIRDRARREKRTTLLTRARAALRELRKVKKQ